MMHCPPDQVVVRGNRGKIAIAIGTGTSCHATTTNPSIALAKTLRDHDCLILPGAYDAFSAKLVQESGFDAVYVGSYATAAAGFGLPDVGALTLDQLTRHAGSIVGAVDLPVIADAEGGFFEPPNMWRTIRALRTGRCRSNSY